MSLSLPLERKLQLLLDKLAATARVDGARVLLRLEEDLQVRLECANSQATRSINGVRVPLAAITLFRDAIALLEPQAVTDVLDPAAQVVLYRPLITHGILAPAARTRAMLVVPLLIGEAALGCLLLESNKAGRFSSAGGALLELASSFASLIAVTISNSDLLHRAQTVAEVEERARLSRELHDSVSQALYSVQLMIRTARARIDSDPAAANKVLDLAIEQSGLAHNQMRSLIYELRPESLEQDGLPKVLQNIAKAHNLRSPLSISVELGDFEDKRVNPAQRLALMRIAQESLHNVEKHANARTVVIRLGASESEARIAICDDGRGFDATLGYPGHYGLAGMRERVEQLFGLFEIESGTGKGTCVRATLPLYG